MKRRDFLTTVGAGLFSGCAALRYRPAFLAKRQRVLRPEATLDEIVDELNRNVLGDGLRPGLASWRSDHVRVSFGPLAMLSGTLSVQTPRDFRMQVSMPVGGHVADFGSNGDEFWWWTKDQQALAVGRHDEAISANAPIPFEPEWLLDVLGVTPIDVANLSVNPRRDGSDTVELVKHVVGSDGQPVTRVRRVRLSTGEVIGHEIRSENGMAIAKAEVIQHARDPNTGILLPQKVHVEWPSYGVSFTLHIAGHEVNPTHLAAGTFERPTRADWPVVCVTRPITRGVRDSTPFDTRPAVERVVHESGRTTIDSM